ncbi:MAG TPA: hypothetical protein DIC60_08825 [Lachnospiraceae bacterium]|nr:hypothetical protein [Lachnospiraceae bacterium]
MEHINDLLKEIAEKVEIYNESSTEKYNIFKVLEVYDKEAMMCRVLTYILNPIGYHNRVDGCWKRNLFVAVNSLEYL